MGSRWWVNTIYNCDVGEKVGVTYYCGFLGNVGVEERDSLEKGLRRRQAGFPLGEGWEGD